MALGLDFARTVCGFALGLTVLAIGLLAVHCVSDPAHPLPVYLSRRLFAAHLFACLFMELREELIWQELVTWTLALHILYFGLCERGQRLLTRLLHGPSFAGAHAVLITYLFVAATERRQVQGLGNFWATAWQLWLRSAPFLLHWADGLLNFKELQNAYSPPMTGTCASGTTSVWDAGGLIPALRFASSRTFFRAWSAAAGYFVFECVWSAATQPTQRDFGFQSLYRFLEVTDMEEVLRLAASLIAYSVFTHRLFVTPSEPAATQQKQM
mmetsp:Transcript_48078/g.107975  ORF Transcript_48078/g.107975 Transcript_48078/m.107975 type:complete len:269 (+) Transcript_48078:53-859(+)